MLSLHRSERHVRLSRGRALLLLFLLTGLSWVSHGSRRTWKRKTIELATGPSDAQALETLPLNPPEAHGTGGVIT